MADTVVLGSILAAAVLAPAPTTSPIVVSALSLGHHQIQHASTAFQNLDHRYGIIARPILTRAHNRRQLSFRFDEERSWPVRRNILVRQLSSTPTLHASLLPVVDDWTPLYLSSIAGASTCIGAAIVFLFPKDADGTRKISPEILSFSLALAGSVMITVSTISIGPECVQDVTSAEEVLHRIASFLVGGGIYYLISHFILPEPENVVRDFGVNNGALKGQQAQQSGSLAIRSKASQVVLDDNHPQQRRAWRLAVLLFISLLFHNFPEGLAVSASAMENDRLGLAVAAGIAMHNIPEGICISVPCLAARPESPWLAFVLASISGLAEPIAALVPILLLSDDASIVGLGNILAFAAGIMVTVALRELLPEARRQLMHGHDNARKTGDGEAYYYGGLLVGFILMYGTETFLDGAL